MTREQAESELMQIYMSLSEEKKKALDVAFKAMEQSMPTMVYPQVDGITPTVVAQADGEKTCGTCRNEDTYHCAECENKSDYEQSQADGEYISRKALLEDLYKRDYTKFTHRDFVALVQYQDIVAMPPEHDGCKDCRWQSQSETEMPCKQCMHNYTDEWERAKTGHWILQPSNKEQGERDFVWWKCSECGQVIYSETEKDRREYHAFCGRCGKRMER